MTGSGHRAIGLARDPGDPFAAYPSIDWAIAQLREVLLDKGASVDPLERADAHNPPAATVLVSGCDAPSAREILARSAVSIPKVPEALGLVPGRLNGRGVLLACGVDPRGLLYAVLELADRVACSEDPVQALRFDAPTVERPANAVRSVARLFCSELEDKPWLHDENFWCRYLSMLAVQRFNRFSLTLGLGYNFPRHVTDAYLYFAYPFLLAVPGYDVHVPELPDDEREQNLAMLRFASEQAVARGIDFQLGLWTHAFEWIDSPDARHSIEGLTPERHAAYCRDAVLALLEACPAIGGLTFRIHGESGIHEGSTEFWRTVFDGVTGAGRKVGIDLHAKGLDAETLALALDTGMPVTVSPKFSAEHMGLPYHQAAIRELERMPRKVRQDDDWFRYMTVSEGSRPFTRYGYGDFLREDRPYDIVYRLWAGTQRLLLWGDPSMAAAYGRVANIAGSQGLEWCEPLTFKGREGSGIPGSRTGYADPSLVPAGDWEKYAYTYRLFGRLTYDPNASPEIWRRSLRAHIGAAARDAEAALASASRILPLVTVAHHPSASNNYYWPEIYTDMPIVSRDGVSRPNPYLDTPIPRRFGTVSPLDPEIFSSVAAFVDEVLSGDRSGRHSPLVVAEWLERLAGDAARHRAEMEARITDPADPHSRRLIVDVAIQEALGRFFAGKLRAAVLYELSVRVGSRALLRDALEAYRAARAGWADAVDRASGVYVNDLTFGPEPYLRGHWADRLTAIDQDIEDMTELPQAPPSRTRMAELEARRLVAEVDQRPPDVAVSHQPPRSFRRGVEIPIALDPGPGGSTTVTAVRLRYRRMDQSEPYSELEMARRGERFVTTIPGGYSDSPYPLQYFFVLRDARGAAWLYPDLSADLSNQPYLVLQGDQEERRPHGRGKTFRRPALSPSGGSLYFDSWERYHFQARGGGLRG